MQSIHGGSPSVCVSSSCCLFTVRPQQPTLTQSGATTGLSGTSKVLTCATASTGVAFSYKFYKDTVEVTAGVSGNELTLSSPTTSDSGSYTCDVTATATSALSAESAGVAINFIGKFGQDKTSIMI